MENFENIVASLLRAEGYWVHQSYKVSLTKEQKKKLGKPSMPRPELDIVAYKGSTNHLLVLEVKSFFDSPGVRYSEISAKEGTKSGRYKLFTWTEYWDVVRNTLLSELNGSGMIAKGATISLGLAAGKVKNNDDKKIANLMLQSNWFYWSPCLIKKKVESLADRGYENDPIYLAAKILTAKCDT